ncbi:MAG: class I SAM-dependent methyltransferase [Rhodothermales bacterium]
MWDERYSTEEYIYGTDPNDFLAEMAGSLPVGQTLCLADGEGRNGVYLAGLGHAVTAVDSSSVGLDKARRLAATRGVEIATVHADLADFSIEPGAWDAVVSIFCHLPGALRRAVHRRVVEGLKPGGVLLLEAYTPDQLRFGTGGPPDVDRLMRLADLKTELDGLTFEVGRELERDVIEGRFHGGRGAVVQVFARKK